MRVWRTWRRRALRPGGPALRLAAWLAVSGALVAAAPAARAQEPARDAQDSLQADARPAALSVGLYESPPFVIGPVDAPTGMAVDLWESLAADADLAFDYVSFDTYGDLIDATAGGAVDVAVTNLTITEARAIRVDFTQPWFDGGMRIMVDDDASGGFLAAMRRAGHLRTYGWIAGLVLIGTLLLTVFDRRFNPDFPRRWRDGLAESFYSAMSAATTGRMPSRANLFGWIGRIWQALWLVCGVAVLAYVTSSVTSVMTTMSLTRQINDLADLPGRRVAVLAGSVGEEFARAHGLSWRAYPTVDEAAAALGRRAVEAVVADAPVLEYHVFTHPEGGLAVVGPIFAPDKYGFGLPPGSALAKDLTLGILRAHESGRLSELRQRYFGSRG